MAPVQSPALDMLWLELTHQCNLECLHCYTQSSPRVRRGMLREDDWVAVINDAAEVGTRLVCFIGGEPTLNPSLERLIDHASDRGLQTEVYSNLVAVSERLWNCFVRNSTQIATSMYATSARAHDQVTTHHGSHARTSANLHKAKRLGLQVRVGVVDVVPEQDVGALSLELKSRLGVDANVDRHRAIARTGDGGEAAELCGRCAAASLAVDPDGNVFPCIMSRWMNCGNVQQARLHTLLAGAVTDARATLSAEFLRLGFHVGADCNPASPCAPHQGPCGPNCGPGCDPMGSGCPPNCGPMVHGCDPQRSYCSPNYPGPR